MFGRALLISKEKKPNYDKAYSAATLVSTTWYTSYGGYYTLGASVKLSPYVWYNFVHNGVRCSTTIARQIPMSGRNDYWYSIPITSNISIGINPAYPTNGSISIGVGTRGSWNGFSSTQQRSDGYVIWEGNDKKLYKTQLTPEPPPSLPAHSPNTNPAVYSATGSYSWRVPSGVTHMTMWDGGGSRINWNVSAGQTFSITISGGNHTFTFPGGGMSMSGLAPVYIQW